jgi:hypothetical protein
VSTRSSLARSASSSERDSREAPRQAAAPPRRSREAGGKDDAYLPGAPGPDPYVGPTSQADRWEGCSLADLVREQRQVAQ